MTKKQIKIGLLGFGFMGKTHAFAINSLPYFCGDLPFHASIRGVCTRSLEKSKTISAEFAIPVATDHAEELIRDPEIDVIDICTPNVFHADAVRRALAAGKHVYCEKPLADTLANAEEMAELARQSGCICNVVFNNRHLSAVRRAKELIDEGRIGRILSFDFHYLHNSCTDPDRKAGWKQTADICGKGGVLFDLGAHVLDLAVWLCGELDTVIGKSQIAFSTRADANGKPWQTDAPEAFYMLVTTKSGAHGTVTASKLTMGTNDDLGFTVYGTKGALKFSLMNPNYLGFYDNTAPHEPYGGTAGFTQIECVGRYPAPAGTFPSPKAAQGWLRGHVMGMYDFLNAVYEGKQGEPSFTHGAYIQRIMDSALRSDETGKEVQI
jgi:predicted dehydrogenase